MENLDFVSYKDAGVDIESGDHVVEQMKPAAELTHTKGVLSGIGGFASLFALKECMQDIEDPVLASGTDGVGTKLLIAIEANRHENIGQDLVAMCANDVLTVGAKPIFFLDYFASGRLAQSPLVRVVQSISRACQSIGCALIGGESAEMPSMYHRAHYDLAGFCVGVVDRSRIIDGTRVRPGDKIIGLSSSGLHSNGFSLARKIIFERMQKSISDVGVADALLTPTRLYVNPILEMLRTKAPILAMAHITGGGLSGNLMRNFPRGLSAQIDKKSWNEPHIFDILRRQGPVDEDEMRKTFNLGIGFCLVSPALDASSVVKELNMLGENAMIIGDVIERDGPLIFLE